MNDYKNEGKQTIERIMVDNEIKANQEYFSNNPKSSIILFERELREYGFEFKVSSQVYGYMPKYRKVIQPLAVKYYKCARDRNDTTELNYFVRMFQYKGCDKVIPMLLEDFKSDLIHDSTKWFIADCLYQIRSRRYINEYLEIISTVKYGRNRQMVILLIGKLRVEKAIPILVELLEDEEVRLHAICALGDFKNPEFKPYFERFLNDKHSGWRKYAKAALKKITN